MGCSCNQGGGNRRMTAQDVSQFRDSTPLRDFVINKGWKNLGYDRLSHKIIYKYMHLDHPEWLILVHSNGRMEFKKNKTTVEIAEWDKYVETYEKHLPTVVPESGI